MRGLLARPYGYYLATSSIAFLIFLIACDARILAPTYVQWLFAGDLSTHWIGWHFFRTTSFLQWPLGANPDYGSGLQSTIVFSDSIPILAFLFRNFSAGLPALFQYFGLWVALCFVLQGIVAFHVLRSLLVPSLSALLGSIFFVLAPPFLVRVGSHPALAGQWLILLALYCLFSKKYLAATWVSLAVISVLVHAYLMAMVLAIWLTDLVIKVASSRISVRAGAAYLLGQFGLVVLAMWSVGYFAFWPTTDGGYGGFNLNILSPLNPDRFSRFMPELASGPAVFEGTAYFGIGVLCVIALALVTRRFGKITILDSTTKVALSALCVGLTGYALSHNIAFGNHERVLFELPAFVRPITSAFRSSGRFFWPVHYVVIFLSFAVFARRFGGRLSAVVLALALGIQLFDFWPALTGMRERQVIGNSSPSAVLSSAIWNEIPRRYRKLVVVVPHNAQDRWEVFAHYAAVNRLSVNTGYFARSNEVALAAQRQRLSELVFESAYEPDTAYIFEDPFLWRVALDEQPARSYRMFEVDGVRLLLPDSSTCDSCREMADAGVSEELVRDERYTGVVARFVDWSGDEGTHRWNGGKSSRLWLRLDRAAQGNDACLEIDYLTLGHQTVSVSRGRRVLGAFDLADKQTWQLNVGPAESWIDLTLSFSNPHSPEAADPRLLAFAIRAMRARACEPPLGGLSQRAASDLR